jgi:hypothetical protein
MALIIVKKEKRRRAALVDIRECFRCVHDPDNPALITDAMLDATISIPSVDPTTNVDSPTDNP